MKILIMSDTFFPQVNGVASVAYSSAIQLSSEGHEVVVAIPASKENRNNFYGEPFSVIFLPSVSIRAYPGERAVLPGGIALFRHLRKWKPHVIHSHTPFGAGWLAIFAKYATGAKLVGTHHTFFDHYLRHVNLDFKWARWLSWKYTVLYYSLCDRVISPSRTLADNLSSYGLRRKTEVFPNGVDTRLFRPLSMDEKNIVRKAFGVSGTSFVYMGRLSYEKNIDDVIHAFSEALKISPDIFLVIIGDGPEKENLERESFRLGIDNRVLFTGILRGQKLAEVLGAQDVFITASRSENHPLSVVEGMASGLPVVAVAEKGLCEIVMHGENGLLSPGGDILKLSNSICAMAESAENRQEMGASARLYAENLSKEKIGQALSELYFSMLS